MIIDEDIMLSICNSQHNIQLQDINTLLERTTYDEITSEQYEQLNYLQKLNLGIPISFEREAQYYPLKLLKKYGINSNFNSLQKDCVLCKNQDNIVYIYPYKLPKQKVIILSATSNEYIYIKSTFLKEPFII